uniref:Uncharacterized protein n=1 Tax=Brassica campestris TaxID=3711 RepID=M4FBD3_BRACM
MARLVGSRVRPCDSSENDVPTAQPDLRDKLNSQDKQPLAPSVTGGDLRTLLKRKSATNENTGTADLRATISKCKARRFGQIGDLRDHLNSKSDDLLDQQLIKTRQLEPGYPRLNDLKRKCPGTLLPTQQPKEAIKPPLLFPRETTPRDSPTNRSNLPTVGNTPQSEERASPECAPINNVGHADDSSEDEHLRHRRRVEVILSRPCDSSEDDVPTAQPDLRDKLNSQYKQPLAPSVTGGDLRTLLKRKSATNENTGTADLCATISKCKARRFGQIGDLRDHLNSKSDDLLDQQLIKTRQLEPGYPRLNDLKRKCPGTLLPTQQPKEAIKPPLLFPRETTPRDSPTNRSNLPTGLLFLQTLDLQNLS